MITIQTVSDKSIRLRLGQQKYLQKMKEIQRNATSTCDMGKKTASFWLMENLSAAFLKTAQPGESLRDPELPVEIRPISHCGMGIAAVEVAGFEPHRIIEVIDAFSDPEYRLFAYEGSGAMLALYEPDIFLLGTRGIAFLGLLSLAALRQPEKEKFVQYFEPEIQRLIAHGFGRMLYFKNHSIAGAICDAQRAAFLRTHACVQGVAFAYSMVNNSDLGRVFRAGYDLKDTPVGPAFREGLIYALEFWEWMAPGFLQWLKPRTAFESGLIESADEEIARCRACGPLAPFTVMPH
ncbi:MAG TPA: hypothetical protein VE398_23085 [Acidobacteriota bacterium]|nr:hypothetical protein [Acidobacteriota bacterium]